MDSGRCAKGKSGSQSKKAGFGDKNQDQLSKLYIHRNLNINDMKLLRNLYLLVNGLFT